MASGLFLSFIRDNATGVVDLDNDTFWMTLHTAAFVPNAVTMSKRSNLTNEVVGAGYTAGGQALQNVIVSLDTTNRRLVFTSDPALWPNSTITARYAVIYKRRGGAATADELVAYLDIGYDLTSSNGNLLLTPPSPGWFLNNVA